MLQCLMPSNVVTVGREKYKVLDAVWMPETGLVLISVEIKPGVTRKIDGSDPTWKGIRKAVRDHFASETRPK